MIVLGIDPGKSGGLAMVATFPGRPPKIVDAVDVPIGADDRVDVAAVISFIQANPPDVAVVERVSPMPSTVDQKGMGATSAFNYGAAVFSVRTCVVGMGVRLIQIEPTAWKKFHGLSKLVDPATGERLEKRGAKEAGRQKALKLFANGDRYFPNIGHHNRAEACLIALCGAALA